MIRFTYATQREIREWEYEQYGKWKVDPFFGKYRKSFLIKKADGKCSNCHKDEYDKLHKRPLIGGLAEMTKDEEVAKEKVQKFLDIVMEEMRKYSLISVLRQYSFTENDYEIVREWFKERGLEL